MPYKGAAPALIDLIASRIDFMFASYASLHAFVDDKRVRALAVASPRRLASCRPFPTMADAGFANVTMTSQFGLAAPANTPTAIVQTLNAAFTKAIRDPALIRKTAGQGLDFAPSTPAEFTRDDRTGVQEPRSIAQAVIGKPLKDQARAAARSQRSQHNRTTNSPTKWPPFHG